MLWTKFVIFVRMTKNVPLQNIYECIFHQDTDALWNRKSIVEWLWISERKKNNVKLTENLKMFNFYSIANFHAFQIYQRLCQLLLVWRAPLAFIANIICGGFFSKREMRSTYVYNVHHILATKTQLFLTVIWYDQNIDLNISKSKFFKSRKNDLINCLILGIFRMLVNKYSSFFFNCLIFCLLSLQWPISRILYRMPPEPIHLC